MSLPARTSSGWNGALFVFDVYRFDNLQTDEHQVLDGWSYVWAALAGPVYVLLKGFVVTALVMVPISAAIAAAAVGALVITVGLFGSDMINILAAFAIPIIALAAQGVIAIELIRLAYIRRGWREGY
jgi:hypothetical protein